MPIPFKTVVFDLGGVLIDWNPRYFYRPLFKGNDAAMEFFLAHVCSPDWNSQQDAGRCFAEAEAEAKTRHPDKAALIDAWRPGFGQMLGGSIAGTVELLAQLRATGISLYALTNWAEETFPIALEHFDFLSWFKGIVVSGQEKLAKPDPRIFELLAKRYALDPRRTLYIDDNAPNIAVARTVGSTTILFTTPESLRVELERHNLLQRPAP